MIENITNFTFNHSDQADDLYKVMTATEVKQAFDSRGNELKDKINEVITQSNTNETEISKRTLSTDFETHKISGDHDTRYPLKTNTYTKTETNNLVAGVTLGQIPNDSLSEQKMANDMKKDIVGGVTSYNEYKTFKDNTTSSLSDLATGVSDKTTILTANGTANTINLNVTLEDKGKYSFKATADSTGAVSINGIALKKIDGTPISNLKANKVYDFYYDEAQNSVFILAKAEGTATVDKVLAGEIFSNGEDTGLIGTMPNRGTFNLGLGVSVPEGYYTGGTTANGKMFATGTTTSTSATRQLYGGTGSTFPTVYTVEVSGLDFRPSIVLLYSVFPNGEGEYFTEYNNLRTYAQGVTTLMVGQNTQYSGTPRAYNVNYTSPSSNTVHGAFTLPFMVSGVLVHWYAFE